MTVRLNDPEAPLGGMFPARIDSAMPPVEHMSPEQAMAWSEYVEQTAEARSAYEQVLALANEQLAWARQEASLVHKLADHAAWELAGETITAAWREYWHATQPDRARRELALSRQLAPEDDQ